MFLATRPVTPEGKTHKGVGGKSFPFFSVSVFDMGRRPDCRGQTKQMLNCVNSPCVRIPVFTAALRPVLEPRPDETFFARLFAEKIMKLRNGQL